MNLAFVSPRFPQGGVVGGAETLLAQLAGYAARAGHRVEFLTTCARSHYTWENEIPAGSREVDGLLVRHFPVDAERDVGVFLAVQERISRGREVSLEDQRRWLEHSVNSRALTDYLREEGRNFDAILGGPYLFGITFHALQVHAERSWLVPCLHDEPFAYQPIMRELFERVRGILFNAEPEQDLARRLFGLDSTACAVVGMGLEPFAADPAAFAARRGLTASYLLYSGRREPLKGTPLLLDYVTAYRRRTGRDIKLVLTGSGEIDPPEELAGHVIDAGYLSEREKREAMAGALAFVHPSVNESLGIVLLEAWLAGAPALVHARSAVLSWQCRRGGGGLWFRHYPEFELMLDRLILDPDLRARLARSGREYVLREYAWDAVGRRLFEALARP